MTAEVMKIVGHLSFSNVLAILALIGTCKVFYELFLSPLKNIPGPFLAKFTNLWRLLSVLTRHSECYERKLHDQHGRAVRWGPNMISLSDPAMINEIYSQKPVLQKVSLYPVPKSIQANVRQSEFYAPNDFLVNGRRFSNMFSTRDEAYNTAIKKPVHKLYTTSNLLRLEPLLDQTISFFMYRLTEKFVDPGHSCDMASWLHYCAWDIMSEMTFSKRMGFLDQGRDVNNTLKNAHSSMDYFSLVAMMPWVDNFLDKNPMVRIGPTYRVLSIEFCKQRVAARRDGSDGHDEESTRDFLDHYVECRKEDPDHITESTILAYVSSNVVVGSDTVAAELRTIMYYLCRDKTVMRRLQNELDQAQIQVPTSWAQTQQAPYLCACVYEGLRLQPGINLPLERVVGVEGLVLSDGETFIPPGTVVGMNPFVVNRDRTVFGEDPHVYHPERWLQSSEEKAEEFEQRVSRMRNSLFTFGAGKRVCPGKALVIVECHKIIGSLARAFDIELTNPDHEWETRNSFFMKQTNMDMRLMRREL